MRLFGPSMRADAGRIRRARMIEAIEQEFDEPLGDIITGMREQGCNWSTIAGALDIGYNTLLAWRRDLRLTPLDRRRVIERRETRRRDVIAAQFGHPNFSSLYAELRLNQNMLVRDIAKKIGVHENTVYKWVPTRLKTNRYIETPARMSSRETNLKRAREIKRHQYGTLWTP